MGRLTNSGFYFGREVFADNSNYYRRRVIELEKVMRKGNALDKARADLRFSERFSTGEENSRLVAHKVHVYKVNNPSWVWRGKLLVPNGDLEELSCFDLGETIKKICEEETEEVIGDKEIDLGDGTIVRGVQIRKSKYEGPSSRKVIPNPYMDIIFDSSDYKIHENFCYSFTFKKEPFMDVANPIEIHITRYLNMNEEVMSEDIEFARGAFEKSKLHFSPVRFSKIIFNKT